MKTAVFGMIICMCAVFFSGIAFAEGSATSIQKGDYVVVGVGSGSDKPMTTVVVVDTRRRFAWHLSALSTKMANQSPKWEFRDLSDMEPTVTKSMRFEE